MRGIKILKRIFLGWGILFFVLFFPRIVAAERPLQIYVDTPSHVKVGDVFNIEVGFRTTEEMELASARVVIYYPTKLVQLQEVTLNKDLFCNYPEDSNDRLIDTENGEIMLTGFSTGEDDCSYPTILDGDHVPFFRLRFKALSAGKATFSFAYAPDVSEGAYTYALKNASPPLMVLGKPESFSFTISDYERPTEIPKTGITEINSGLGYALTFLVIGGLIFIVGYLTDKFRAPRTVVLVD